jgi:hypothetical protein
MSKFTLSNKWSSEVSSRPTFELGDLAFFGDLPQSGVMPMPMIVENRIGSEMVLMLYDKTPFVSTLAKMKSLALILTSGLVHTSHGPVIFLFFHIPNAATPDHPYFAFVNYTNPFNSEQMATLWSLANQSHWHLILVDGDQRVKAVEEYKNVFGLDETLANNADAISDKHPGDFALATLEFSNKYTLQDLLNMKSSPVTNTTPMRYTLEIVPGKSIGPFRLGMTSQEINDAMRLFSSEPLTLEDLGMMADFPKEETPDSQKRCNRLQIRVVNNDHTLLLRGQPVNDISNADADSLFSSISPDVRRSYACLSLEEAGIEAIRWEHSDDWIYCFFVIPPAAPSKDAPAPVFGSGLN